MFKNTFINTTLIQSIRHPGRPSGRQPQAGFIQGVLLFGIALLAVVIAAFSFSNKSSSNSTAAEEAKTYASTIIAHGNALKTAADRFRADRGDLSSMTFEGGTATNGLFNTMDAFITSGTLIVQTKAFSDAPKAEISDTQNGHFFLKRKGTIKIGGNTVLLMTATGPLSDATCRRININLHRINKIPNATPGAEEDFRGTANGRVTIGVGSKESDFPNSVSNLEEGCVQTDTANKYYYFKVLQRS